MPSKSNFTKNLHSFYNRNFSGFESFLSLSVWLNIMNQPNQGFIMDSFCRFIMGSFFVDLRFDFLTNLFSVLKKKFFQWKSFFKDFYSHFGSKKRCFINLYFEKHFLAAVKAVENDVSFVIEWKNFKSILSAYDSLFVVLSSTA